MKGSPYSHKPEESPREKSAKQQGALNILSALVANNLPQPMPGVGQETMAPPGGAPWAPISPSAPMPGGNPMQGFQAPPSQPQQAMDTNPVVQMETVQGPEDFKLPPVEGYWLGVLEQVNTSDPYKQGPDWRDEAIVKFRETRQMLDEVREFINLM